ncbi:MAG: mandelate racemase/muconate lactonizing enzyme family protein, partial [Caldilineaceae bacterium]|nr:mandelate racemase/muconate lactonizing enzyme family protein [Caldilineaceae bacterium]
MALYDLVGKAFGVPVYRLFNLPQVREWCPIAWWNTKTSPEDLAAEAQDALEAGYIFHKFKARPFICVYEQVGTVSAVTPPHYRLDIDWNGLLRDVGAATPVLQKLDQYERISIYEGPIPQDDVAGLRELRRKIAHPVALHFGVPPFPTAIQEEVCDGFVINGGVSRILHQGALAAEFKKPFWLQMVGTGLVTALSAQLGAVLPFARWPTITCLNNYSDSLLTTPLTIQGGYLQVPDGPGLGVEVNEAALETYRMEAPYELPEPRHILSVVWPGGRVVHFANMRDHTWPHFMAGNDPAQEPGVRLEIWDDDGSPEWADLYARVQQAPVRDQR